MATPVGGKSFKGLVDRCKSDVTQLPPCKSRSLDHNSITNLDSYFAGDMLEEAD